MWRERLRSRVFAWRDRLTVRMQIGMAALLLGAVLVGILASIATQLTRGRAIEAAGADLARVATALADGLDHYMHARYQQVRTWARLEPLRALWGSDPARLRGLLDEMKASFPEYRWIGFATADGLVRASTGSVLEGVSLASWPSFRTSLQGAVLQDVQQRQDAGPASEIEPTSQGLHFVDIAFPVRDAAGGVIGALCARVDWSWAAEIRDSVRHSHRIGTEMELWVIAAGGEPLLGPDAGRTTLSERLRAEIHAQGKGWFLDRAHDTLSGYAVANGFRDYPGLNWIVLARRPAAAAVAQAREIGWIVAGIGALAVLFGAVLFGFAADRVAAPMRALAAHADRVGRDPGASMIPRLHGAYEMLQLSTALRSLLLRLSAGERSSGLAGAIQESSELDALTGLMNRRAFLQQAEDAMRYFQRYGRSIATLVLDVDRFKRLNERFGPAAGDAIIRKVGEVITEIVRTTDKVGRYGSEEFVVLLREIDAEQTLALAERIRHKVEATAIIHGSDAIGVTVSIGAAVVWRGDRDVEDLIQRADRALYVAKNAGRNCVRMAPSGSAQRAA